MTGDGDSCRLETLPSGETVRVHGGRPMTPLELEMLAEIVAAATARLEEHGER